MKRVFLGICGLILGFFSLAEAIPPNEVRAAYLSAERLHDRAARERIRWLLRHTEINSVVIDCKESSLTPLDPRVKNALQEFKDVGAYTICRFVVAQDNLLVAEYPEAAVRIRKSGPLWHSRRWEIKDQNGKTLKIAELNWVDMASPKTYLYNLEKVKQVIELGFDEINFDYIRFPTDGPKEKYFPFWDNMSPQPSKCVVIQSFLEKIAKELRALKKPNGDKIVISLDPFGYAFFGAEPGIGQCLLGMAEYADVVMPMTYGSHYRCGEFGFRDPTLFPREVVYGTLIKGLKILRDAGRRTVVRPWIQDFSIQNIYGCYDEARADRYEWRMNFRTGKNYFFVPYREREVRSQIDVGRELGLNGYALWNTSNEYTKEALVPKK